MGYPTLCIMQMNGFRNVDNVTGGMVAWGAATLPRVAAAGHPVGGGVIHTESLTAHEAALARSRAYDLLGRLWAGGLTDDLLAYVDDLPGLAAAAPRPFAAREAAAEHHAVLVQSVFPYAGYFLGVTGLVGGPVADAVLADYAACGYRPAAGAPPDHLATALGALAFLCGAEADASRDGVTAPLARLQRLQATFLASHLLNWIVPVTVAVERTGVLFYVALAGLTRALVLDHGRALAVETAAGALPAPPDLLADSTTGVKEIARLLLLPAHSGLFLSRDDLRSLGRGLHLPAGFGSREQTLANLLRTAAAYDAFPALLAALGDLMTEWQRAYRRISTESPLAAHVVAPWLAQTEKTAALLAGLDVLALEDGAV